MKNIQQHDHNHNCGCTHHHNHIDEIDDTCDIDPSKICDNCMKCLDIYNTDKEGFVQIKVDKIDTSKNTLEDFYMMYGLNDDDEE